MSESNFTPDQNIDDKLAGFTDQVLAAKSEGDTMSQDLELQKLEEMVLLLNRAATAPAVPPREMQTRIHAKLVDVWHENFSTPQSSILQRLAYWLQEHQKQMAFAGSALVVALLAVALLPELSGSNLSGSAGADAENQAISALSIVLITLAALLSGILIWFILRVKK